MFLILYSDQYLAMDLIRVNTSGPIAIGAIYVTAISRTIECHLDSKLRNLCVPRLNL